MASRTKAEASTDIRLPPLPATRQPLVASRARPESPPAHATLHPPSSPPIQADSPKPTSSIPDSRRKDNVSSSSNSDSGSIGDISSSTDAFLLLTTFLAHVAQHAYPAALAVADKFLIVEPTNTLVREFQPVLKVRIAQLAAREAAGLDDDDEDESGDEDDDDSADGESSSTGGSDSNESEDTSSDESSSKDDDGDVGGGNNKEEKAEDSG
ncbi:hypothetical protein HDU86_005018 [Geranomyces michiganensis]|nr:hypothetical protein HDU86_005018 [Geranomyces michiganensis]